MTRNLCLLISINNRNRISHKQIGKPVINKDPLREGLEREAACKIQIHDN